MNINPVYNKPGCKRTKKNTCKNMKKKIFLNKRKTIKLINSKKIKKSKKSSLAKGLTIILPNNTPREIDIISHKINEELSFKADAKQSYSPSINRELITLKSLSRDQLLDCNISKAFSLKEPLKIRVGENCYPYSDPKSIEVLLKNLSANKHVNPNAIITPRQSLSNCWFNTMFVSLFISDKGRKFFHFFRSLMIKGHNSANKMIPSKLRNGFALLNFAIDASLTGHDYAYKMDTNAIITEIYEAIPKEFKDNLPYMTPSRKAGNPIRYYASIMHYLNDKSIDMLFISNSNSEWKQMINDKTQSNDNKPHIIVLEFFDDESKTTINKPTKFTLENNNNQNQNQYNYKLDSAIVRDIDKNHFSSLLTCETKEMAYDGMSFHRLVNMNWKKHINTNYGWQFKGSNDAKGNPIEWNFLNGYQMLIYYRV